MANCPSCNAYVGEKSADSESAQSETELILQDDSKALERVRELELELAQTKLAHVEAECRNQVCNSLPNSKVVACLLVKKMNGFFRT